jgi:hypothetical protein
MALAVFVMYVIWRSCTRATSTRDRALDAADRAGGGLATLYAFGEPATLYAFVGMFI